MSRSSLLTLLAGVCAVALALPAATTPVRTVDAAEDDKCFYDGELLDIEDDRAWELYECIVPDTIEGWQQSGDVHALAYRDWAVTATAPAAPGAHTNRFLFTYANDIAAEQYLKYETDGVVMPVGSVLVKESFGVRGQDNPDRGHVKGELVKGPLFIMEKTAPGTFDETDNWAYALITPNGDYFVQSGGVRNENVQAFCHECHAEVLGIQDALWYPAFHVRFFVD